MAEQLHYNPLYSGAIDPGPRDQDLAEIFPTPSKSVPLAAWVMLGLALLFVVIVLANAAFEHRQRKAKP
ncbi:MAG: hypothetical protein WAU78_10110 [Roseiarcus sp.]|jgi:hypothetical protein